MHTNVHCLLKMFVGAFIFDYGVFMVKWGVLLAFSDKNVILKP
jgi:hypothetical protein